MKPASAHLCAWSVFVYLESSRKEVMNAKFRTKLFNLVALIAVLALAIPFAASADTVTNNVIVGGNDTITAGGSTTITYTLTATNGDGQNGCNAPSSSPATMTINKSTAVTAPTSIQLGGCDTPFPVTFSSNTPGNYNISVSVTGGRGGTYTTSGAAFTLKVLPSDTTPPVLTLPANITAEATSSAGAAVIYSASATDAVDGAVAITCSPASGSTFALGTTTVNCSAKDSKNNTATGSFSVTVRDTTPPQIANTPSNMTVEAASASGAVVSYSNPTAIDLVSGSVAVNCSPASGSTFSLGAPHTITCTATDGRSNSSTSTFTIEVKDTTSPVLVVGDVIEEATGPNGAVVNYTATAHDLVDGSLMPDCEPESGTTFALGTMSVNCSVSDSNGNNASASFNVTVQDTIAPVIGPRDAVEAEATGPDGAVVNYTSPATTDAVDGNGIATCAPVSGGQFPLGPTTVTCNATDAAGNAATPVTFSVVVVDTTPPTVIVPDDISVEATGPDGAGVTFSASASDIVNGVVSTSCLPASGTTFPLGTTTVTCSAHDAANNIGTGTFKVTIADTTAPELSLPANIVQEATGPNGNAVSFGATASDIVSGSVAVTCSPASESVFAIATTTVSCSATDGAGNTATGSFIITVQDTIAPVVNCGTADGQWRADNVSIPCTANDSGSGVAAADQTFTLSTSVPAGSEIANAATSSRTITDQAGNSIIAGPISGNKIDRKGPALTWNGSIVTGTTYYYGSVPAAPTCTATDAGSGPKGCTVSGYSTTVGTHTLSATATDNVGNTTTETRSYTVAAWTFKGFYQPVDMNNVYNTVKGGSTVPFKFEVFAGSTELTDVSNIKSLSAKQISCSTNASLDDIEVTATGGTSLRYDSTAGQYVYNWQTPKAAGNCYSVTISSLDGSSAIAFFKLR
jgi:large repetitive protein